jgi:hypothetical protein
MEAMKAALHLDIVHVPYHGTGEAVPALLGNHVQALWAAYPSLKGAVERGDIRLLAHNGLGHSPLLPELPPLSDLVPGFDMVTNIGVYPQERQAVSLLHLHRRHPTGSSPSPIRRVPAAQIEDAVIAQIRAMVQTPEIIVATWRAARKTLKGLTERQVRDELSRFDALWSELFPAEQARLVQLLVDRVDISAKGVEITLRVEGLTGLVQELHTAAGEQRPAA